MKKFISYSIIIITSFLSGIVFGQVECVTDPPLPPVLTSVSVQPETGNTIFTWTQSSSTGIAAYILYSYKNGDGMPIDTIWDPAATSYTLSNTSTKYFSVSYVVSSMRLPRCTSIFSNVLNSIFEVATIDTCLKKIRVSWNSYQSFPAIPQVKLTGYSVLVSVDGGPFSITGNAGVSETSYTLSDFNVNSEYCFKVRANLEGGAYSSSNKTCLSTKMQRPPQWINADQATINPQNKVSVSFTVDPFSDIRQFSLQRKTGNTGTYKEISKPVSVNGSVNFTDSQANPDSINYYVLSAVNSCNLSVMESNIASNIVLKSKIDGNNIILSWNPYKNWLGTISSYRLFINTGNGFEEREVIPAGDSIFIQAYKQIMYQVSGNEVCFYIIATEKSNPHGIAGESISSRTCTLPVEIITVPNVFTPDNDLHNDLFRPVLSFTPVQYHLVISDRQGTMLFETRNYLEEWDGSRNGSPQPQGVYLWFLKVTTPTGKQISRTGTVTIISK
jgi:gliding motility-associated-like protein